MFEGSESNTYIVVAAGVEVSFTVSTLTGNVTVAVPAVTVCVMLLRARLVNDS